MNQMNQTTNPKINQVPKSDTVALRFYDIESLHNIFTVVVLDIIQTTKTAELNTLIIVDDPDLHKSIFDGSEICSHNVAQNIEKHIRVANPAIDALEKEGYTVTINPPLDLAQAGVMHIFARNMVAYDGLDATAHQPEHVSVGGFEKIITDTNPQYNPTIHPICAGYNSYNYDTVMLALLFAEAKAHNHAKKLQDNQHTENPNTAASSADFDKNYYAYKPVTAKLMREHNDKLFSDMYRNSMISYLGSTNRSLGQHAESSGSYAKSLAQVIRHNMLKSGRHIDIARFNEVQMHMGLKRLLAQLGHQLLESDKLSGINARVDNYADIVDLLSYNVSDVIGLKLLFDNPVYFGAFDQRATLLHTYPECTYKQGSDGKPEISPYTVDPWRLTIDSSSAQFVARVLAPYAPLEDIPAVSFMYPDPERAKEMDIEPFDVLEESKKFFEENIKDPQAQAEFNEVYEYYNSIRGKNFNQELIDTQNKKLAQNGCTDPTQFQQFIPLSQIQKRPTTIPYYRSDGEKTSGFAVFSTGGIHGAEYFVDAYEQDMAAHELSKSNLEYAKKATDGDARIIRQAPNGKINVVHNREYVILEDDIDDPTLLDYTKIDQRTIHYSDVLDRGKNALKNNPEWRKNPKVAKPILFKEKPDGDTNLNKKYTYTSMADCIHEDFTSYYPLLLSNMRAFYNPELGSDRYAEIFKQKEDYGKLLKDPNVSKEDKKTYAVLRSGAKLLLNAASGAGDANHRTSIRMNNRIISMRLIGQLFLWRIGQAQTLAGATIVSTNTDGLYSAKVDAETNNRVLVEQAENIHVDIEPEPLTLVSKDSNNRVEFEPIPDPDQNYDGYLYFKENPHEREVISAGGGLACWNGPHPTKRLSKLAIVQHVLVEYFKALSVEAVINSEGKVLDLTDDIDLTTVDTIINRLHSTYADDPARVLTFYQLLVSNSAAVNNFIYAINAEGEFDNAAEITNLVEAQKQGLTHLGHYSRVFLIDEDKAKKINEQHDIELVKPVKLAVTKALKVKNINEPDPVANLIMAKNGVCADDLFKDGQKVTQGKITGLDPTQTVLIHNHSLIHPPTHILTNSEEEGGEQQQQVLSPNEIISCLDMDAYREAIVTTYNNEWRNKIN